MPIAIPSPSSATATQGTQRSALAQASSSEAPASFLDALSEASQQARSPDSRFQVSQLTGSSSERAAAHLRPSIADASKAPISRATAVPARSASTALHTPDGPALPAKPGGSIGDPLAALVQRTIAAQPIAPVPAATSTELPSGSKPSAQASTPLAVAVDTQSLSYASAPTLPGPWTASLATTGIPSSEAAASPAASPIQAAAGILPPPQARQANAASVATPEPASLPPEAAAHSGKHAAASTAPATKDVSTYAESSPGPTQGPLPGKSDAEALRPGSDTAVAAVGSLTVGSTSASPQIPAAQVSEVAKAPAAPQSAGARDGIPPMAQGAASSSIEQAVIAATTYSTASAIATPTVASHTSVPGSAPTSAGKDAIRTGAPGRSAAPVEKVSAQPQGASLFGQPGGVSAGNPRTTPEGSVPAQEKTSEQDGRGGHDGRKAATGIDAATKPGAEGSQANPPVSGPAAAVSPQVVAQSGGAQDANGAVASSALSQAVQPPVVASQGSSDDKQGSQPGELPAAAATPADAQALPAIHTARVLQSMQGTEMRVGMHTAEFGNISVNTSINTALNRQSIAAQISFEHLDLGKALSAHLPQIEAKLSNDYGMQARVEVKDQSAGTATDGNREGGRQQANGGGAHTTPATSSVSAISASATGDGEGSGATTRGSTVADASSHSARLDIRA